MENKRNELKLFDIVVLTVIFFGYAVYNSALQYIALQNGSLAHPNVVFSEAQNYFALLYELVSLLLAFFYLKFRRFNFGRLNFSVNKYTLPLIVLLIVTGAIVSDAVYYIYSYLFYHPEAELTTQAVEVAENAYADFDPFQRLSLGLVLFALVNGFYEEIFFLGLIFCTPKKFYYPIMAFSLAVRFGFHTYQGLLSAVSITTLGVVFILFRRKIQSLLPFMLAHSFFDLFGLGIAFWLYYLAM